MIRSGRGDYPGTLLARFRQNMLEIWAETITEGMEKSLDFKDFSNRCLKVSVNEFNSGSEEFRET